MMPRPGIKADYPVFNVASGIKGPRYQYEISGIIQEVKMLDLEQQENVLRDLGVIPIWFEHFDEIPDIINEILS